jgi:hypothetical protein
VPGVPPIRCTARSKRTHQPCRNWAIPGAFVCRWHGLNGQAMRKANERNTLAQLLSTDPRHPWELVLDACHLIDCVSRDYRAEVLTGETLSIEQLDRLVELSKATHHLATTAISTRAHEHIAEKYTDQGNRLASLITEVVDRLELTVPWRIYALQLVHHLLLTEAGDPSEEPSPPSDPLVQERVSAVTIVDASRAIEGPQPTMPSSDDIGLLADADLRSLAYAVADELERRGILD